MNNKRYIGILLLSCSLCTWGGGWITIRTSVLGTNVAVDQSIGMSICGHERSFYVEDGVHLVMVDKDGYRPYIDTVTITPDANRLIPAWLEPVSVKAQRNTSSFKQTSWKYQLANGLLALRWVGVGGGIATGLNLHVSFFKLRFGLFTIDPCLWGMQVPFFDGMSHVKTPWLVHPRDRRSGEFTYEVAIPNQDVQFYYTPMIGFQLPFSATMAFALSAGPQISWTYMNWIYQYRDFPMPAEITYTSEPFPSKGFQFDPVWFSIQAGVLFNGGRSDWLTYFKYQDGFFVGLEYSF